MKKTALKITRFSTHRYSTRARKIKTDWKNETILVVPTVFLDNPFGSRNWS